MSEKTSSINTLLLIWSVVATILVIVLVTVLMFGTNFLAKMKKITTYKECVAAGYPVSETFPQTCITPDGKTFTNPQLPINNLVLPSNLPSMGIANPASVYCIQNGGKIEIKDEKGGQTGYCTLKSGKVCEEWAYFRGQCKD